MPIPSFSQTLGRSLGPDITVIDGGNFFSDEEQNATPDIEKMNKEMASLAKNDDIVFLTQEPREDIPLQEFIKSQGH